MALRSGEFIMPPLTDAENARRELNNATELNICLTAAAIPLSVETPTGLETSVIAVYSADEEVGIHYAARLDAAGEQNARSLYPRKLMMAEANVQGHEIVGIGKWQFKLSLDKTRIYLPSDLERPTDSQRLTLLKHLGGTIRFIQAASILDLDKGTQTPNRQYLVK